MHWRWFAMRSFLIPLGADILRDIGGWIITWTSCHRQLSLSYPLAQVGFALHLEWRDAGWLRVPQDLVRQIAHPGSPHFLQPRSKQDLLSTELPRLHPQCLSTSEYLFRLTSIYSFGLIFSLIICNYLIS